MAGPSTQRNNLIDLAGLGGSKKPKTREEAAFDKVKSGDVPKMVRWYGPSLLSKIAIRDGFSRSIGELADKRQLMAATDPGGNEEVVNRYDYRTQNPAEPLEGTFVHSDKSYYIDYLSDTGDGFGSTYTMAYLLGAPGLKVPEVEHVLPQGDTLLLGGDQCYPQASREEYKNRFWTPFEWAFGVEKPIRKMFAVPGNHDWYDGLNAFDALFCAARDKLSGGKGEQIGGWQCMQHRSYWALRLPYNWWIWGVDIQFAKYLDLAQTNYFEAVARQFGPDDRVLICIAEPSWMLGELEGKDDEINLPRILSIVRQHGAKVVAVMAGDWHHYSRYTEQQHGVHFITAGGGGAFLHPTHVLKENISVHWPDVAVGQTPAKVDAPVAPGSHAVPTKKVDIKLSAKGQGETIGEMARDVGDVALGPLDDRFRGEPVNPGQKKVAIAREGSSKVYPSKGKSLALSFKNIAFPFYNFGAALLIGFIYWVITWHFQNIVEQEKLIPFSLYDLRTVEQFWIAYKSIPFAVIQGGISSTMFGAMILLLFLGLYNYVPAASKRPSLRFLKKLSLGGTHFVLHILLMMGLALVFVRANNGVYPTVFNQLEKTWVTYKSDPSLVGSVVRGFLSPLARNQDDRAGRRPGEETSVATVQDAQGAARTVVAAPETELNGRAVRAGLGVALYPASMIVIGGMMGGLLLGLYWVIAGWLFRTHAEDAFAALRIRHYKNFLRMRFEPDRLTIYPIGIDNVPGDRDWRMPTKSEGRAHRKTHANNPALVPKTPIEVRLIEKPIVISRHTT